MCGNNLSQLGGLSGLSQGHRQTPYNTQAVLTANKPAPKSLLPQVKDAELDPEN